MARVKERMRFVVLLIQHFPLTAVSETFVCECTCVLNVAENERQFICRVRETQRGVRQR